MREDMKSWVVVASTSLGGKSWSSDVAKFIWHDYKSELRRSGGLLYIWQYGARWAATVLRKTGKLKTVHGRPDLAWEPA